MSLLGVFVTGALSTGCTLPRASTNLEPFVLVLGTGQDGGVPQAGSFDHPGWTDRGVRRLVTSLAIVDPRSGKRWLIDTTPDIREQLFHVHGAAPQGGQPLVSGIFLTHAHIGHYTGLMFFGHESMGASSVPVYAMPRMKSFLETNGPWDQLVRYENIKLHELADGVAVSLAADITVTPLLVPHRQEYTEVVGYRIDGPNRSVLFIPDIDSWTQWDEQGVRIEEQVASVDLALLDGTFYVNGEIPGRDMSGFPHPFITHSMERFGPLPSDERSKIHFLHLNHTNPAQFKNSPARRAVDEAGFSIAEDLDRHPL